MKLKTFNSEDHCISWLLKRNHIFDVNESNKEMRLYWDITLIDLNSRLSLAWAFLYDNGWSVKVL